MEPLYVYNTLTRAKEKFEPLNPPFVGMYVCGPTVYSDVHLGNCRTFISFDVIFRYLTFIGYKVRYVRNITDVGHLESDGDEGEDKISKKARLERLEPMEIVQKYTVGFREVMALFNALPPSVEPSATGHLIEQIEMTKEILDRGYGYVANGSVYFDVEKFAQDHNYGALSGRSLEDQRDNTRDLDGQDEKRGRLDFALWKSAKPEHLMQWNSPWGKGFPGWHIECSAMSRKYLGDTFDIHGGGMDLIPTHHTNEIAQNVGGCGKEPVRYWLHTNMLTVNGVKMSKSLGNSFLPIELFTGRELAADSPNANPSTAKLGGFKEILGGRGYSPMTVRFFMLQTHYSSTLDFSKDALLAAEKGFRRLMEALRTLEKLAPSGESTFDVAGLRQRCYAAMNDDFNTSILLAQLFEAVYTINLVKDGKEKLTAADLDALRKLMHGFIFEVLGLRDDLGEIQGGLSEGLMQLIISLRQKSRQEKNFAMADQIRDGLGQLHVKLKDGPNGTEWYVEE